MSDAQLTLIFLSSYLVVFGLGCWVGWRERGQREQKGKAPYRGSHFYNPHRRWRLQK